MDHDMKAQIANKMRDEVLKGLLETGSGSASHPQMYGIVLKMDNGVLKCMGEDKGIDLHDPKAKRLDDIVSEVIFHCCVSNGPSCVGCPLHWRDQ